MIFLGFYLTVALVFMAFDALTTRIIGMKYRILASALFSLIWPISSILLIYAAAT